MAATAWLSGRVPVQPLAMHRLVKSGTGFFISDRGELLTSAHVVTGCRTISVWRPNAQGIRATVVAADRRLDIAALSISDVERQHAMPSGIGDAVRGEPVSIISFGTHRAAPRDAVLADGRVVDASSSSGSGRVLIIDASVEAGASGAPVIDATGSLLGVVIGRYATARDLAVAIPANEVAAFLARRGIALAASPPRDGQPVDRVALLWRMAVLVQCVPAARRSH